MQGMKLITLTAVAAGGIGAVAQAAPLAPGSLALRTTITVQDDVSPALTGGSNYNPRIYGDNNYVMQIWDAAFGRYVAGSSTASVAVDVNGANQTDRRMISPLGGTAGSTYMLLAGGANRTGADPAFKFTQYDWDGGNPVTIDSPAGLDVSNASFDWVDSNTIIASTYKPTASRSMLYMMDITATGPSFAMSLNSSLLGGNSSVTTSSPYIRNVAVGDIYNGYAYYGNGDDAPASGAFDPNFYALNLSTGVETNLGSWGSDINSAYAGIWSVTERGGYLYVMTTDNGIKVYNMTDGNTLGSLYTTYTQAELDALTGNTTHYYGFDVSPDGSRMLLSGPNATWEIVPEPTSLGLLAIGALALVRRRRRA